MKKEVKNTLKELHEMNYQNLIDLRDRLSNDGSGDIYEDDHLLLDRVLDTLELVITLVNSDNEKTEKILNDLKFYLDNL